MKTKALAIVLSLQLAGGVFACAQQVLPLWPHGTPEPPQTTQPETNMTDTQGHLTNRLTNITQPSMTVFLPGASTGAIAAALVFPGGSYQRLAWEREGIDACRWLNSIDVACLLVKYRVPETGHYPENPADFQDAQQAMRIVRAHAEEWHINPARIGVIGFSSGAHLAAELSNHFDDKSVESTPAAADVEARMNARPEFAILAYPAYLSAGSDGRDLDPSLTPNSRTPPTFLIQAENDAKNIDGSLVYFRALKDAGVPAELHLYATGGTGFGVRPVGFPEEHWARTATLWLQRIGMMAQPGQILAGSQGAPPTPQPCPSHQVAIGRPTATAVPAGPPENPNCL